MTEQDPIIVPKSRLRRELKKWMRYQDAHPGDVITVTLNKYPTWKLMSPVMFKAIQKRIAS